ncbi:hypothetical protein AAHC03_05271 [Spirometra sp. Aus1]
MFTCCVGCRQRPSLHPRPRRNRLTRSRKRPPPTGWHEWISWPSWLLNCLVLDYIRLHTLYLLLQPCLEYVLSICLL